MKRSPSSRAPSPTGTAYSGVSNYRTESYKPIREIPKGNFASDPRAVARTHYKELSSYLSTYLAQEPAGSRSTARQKLTRLTRQQFQELSTDVYDELVRRKNNTSAGDIPFLAFLPVRDDFHPKRNQARQKLATLPTGRFKDLSSDVYYELVRRYPEFKEDPTDGTPLSPDSTYDDYPSPDFPAVTSPPNKAVPKRRPSQDDGGRRSGEGYGGEVSSSPGSMSRRKPSQDVYRGGDRRRPSQDTTGRRSEERERDYPGTTVGRRPSESVSTTSDTTSASNAQSATAGMGMIIPNKSTIAEEEIEVPYGREVRDSSSTAIDDRSRERDRSMERGHDSDSDGEGVPRTKGGLAGLSGLSARLAAEGDDDEGGARSDDYFDKLSFGRASVASDRSAGGGISSRTLGGRTSVGGDEHERLRRDYEFKIATMQTRITGLERDLEGVQEREEKWSEGEERVKAVENELRELRQRMEEKTTAMFAMQQELDNLRQERAREKELAARRAQQDEEELQILRDQCERLEAERGVQGGSELLEQLQSDMEGLLTELSDLSRRNDELMTAKDSDLVVIRDLDAQLKEYKRKYEQAKTELRSVKATSQLFLQAPKTDDQLPVSPDGGVLDIHVTAFVTAIDSLLTAGRSNAPTRVLTPMKAVVNAVSAIVDDVKAFERRPRRNLSDVDVEALSMLRERAEATLSNLVAATKTHATSSGMSPVSLLDAAASHVSSTITEIGRAVLIRKATRAEQEQFASIASAPSNGYIPSLRSVEEVRTSGSHQRGGSSSSSRRGDSISSQSNRFVDSAPSQRGVYGRSSIDERRGPPSNNSSSDASSPPPIFDQAASHNTGEMVSDESANTENPEDAWTELKPYLEAQTEAIVFAIQSVLSAVRSPTPSPSLNENLTQIITIVSSIVAVCKDNLPPACAGLGEEILQELGDHANKLSEVQALPEVTKESRQVMAKSSFAIANAMKALGKL